MNISILELRKLLLARGMDIVDRKYLESLQQDFYLHSYTSYEEYRDTQVHWNKEKIDRVWADRDVLTKVCGLVKDKTKARAGLCHGSRNGFEVEFFREFLATDCIGTDISDTAQDFPNMVQWDFHDENPEWNNAFDFIYSNSLDQSWNPKRALGVWLNQLKERVGMLVIEHTRGHGPSAAGAMDPFGCKVEYMPYLFADWFGHGVSVSVEIAKKQNYDLKAWLFCIRRIGVVDIPPLNPNLVE